MTDLPPDLDDATWRWWTLLRGVSVLNGVLWVATALLAPKDAPVAWAHLALSGIYAVVCAFRSFYPRVDLERTVLVDHPLSAIALGRTSATIAEMAFTVQCALVMGWVGSQTGMDWAAPVGWALVPLIAVAQACCWLGVLTLNHLWHAAEEALWAVMMVAIAAVCAGGLGAGFHPLLLVLGLLGCAAGAFVMVVLDIPMYRARHAEELAAGTRFLSVPEGWTDATTRREPTGAWSIWKHEVAWMTPYFTACVWLSIGLVWL